MRFSIAVVVPLVLAGVSNNVCAQAIIAHRGASYDAPENTLAAFRLAWEQQADGIEGDFYLTQDGRIVCIHDKTTKRVAPEEPELNVAETSLARLRQLDVGRWKDPQFAGERMPTLQEVLATVPPGGQIFVEIKCGPEILPVLKPQLEQSGLKPEQIVIICFDKTVVTQARQMMPQYKANWLTSYKRKTEQDPWKPDRESVIAALVSTQATGLGTNGNLSVINASFVEAVRATGKEFHVWTIDDPDDARTFQSLGVDSITTDRPAFLRQAIGTPAKVGRQP